LRLPCLSVAGAWVRRSSLRSLRLCERSWFCPTKEKPHRTCPQTFGTNPMRLAQCWAEGRRRAIWIYRLGRTIPGQVRVLFFLARNARQLPLPKPPGKNLIEAVHKKPLCSNQQGKRTSKTNYKHRLPQARCLRPTHSFSPGLLQQRAGLKVNIRQFSPRGSNRVTTGWRH